MTFSQLLNMLRARWKVILATLIAVVIVTMAVTLAVPKTYRASTTLLLSYKGTDPVSGQALPAQVLTGYMATQVSIVTSRRVALKAVDNLALAADATSIDRFARLSQGKGDIRAWLADSLLKALEVTPARESSMIEIAATGKDAGFSAEVANGFATAYEQVSQEIRAERSQQAVKYFAGQVKTLRTEFEQAENRLSTYQQEHGLVSTDMRIDVETARLSELSSQLVQAQGQSMDASSRGNQAVGGSGRDSPDVIANTLVQNLKASLAQAEAKFALQAQDLGPNHPQYQAAKAEIDRLRADLNSHITATNNGVANNSRIAHQREAEVRAAFAAQTAKVLQLNRARDQLSVLVKDVESAQHAFDAAALHLNQVELEGESGQSDVSVISPASVPLAPTSPDVVLNLVLSMLFGGMFGLAFAVLLEMADRRVRSGDELRSALKAPILGTIAWDRPAPRESGFFNPLLSRPSQPNGKGRGI